ncbi:MAG: acyltransferase family protein [Parasporobacterium sp.]|nr:acyltransferase family protein [Parasporobacterium sp.]
MTGKERDSSIDILRGIATILVVIGHIPYTPTIIRAWIYTFHVPVFFVCSGILFSPDRYPKFKDYFMARVKGLLVPIFALGILIRLLQTGLSFLLSLLPGIPSEYAITFKPVDLLLSLVLGYRVHEYYYSFWFLYTLFLGELIFYFIVRLFRKRWYLYLLLFAAGIALQAVVDRFAQGFFWSVDLLPAGIAFLSLGYCYRLVLYEKGRKLPFYLFPVMFILSVLFTALNYKNGEQVNLFYDYLGNPVLYALSAVSGCLMCILLANLIKKSRILEFFGVNSLVTYGFQNTICIPLFMELLKLLGRKNELFTDQTFRWIVTVCGTLLLSAAISLAINRFAPFLAGKKRKKKEGKQQS